MEREGCTFPDPNGEETRVFHRGQTVCVRGIAPTVRPAIYARREENMYGEVRHVIYMGNPSGPMAFTRDIPWYDIGTFESQASKIYMRHIGENKGLPNELEAKMAAMVMGGKGKRRKTKRMRRKERKNRKTLQLKKLKSSVGGRGNTLTIDELIQLLEEAKYIDPGYTPVYIRDLQAPGGRKPIRALTEGENDTLLLE